MNNYISIVNRYEFAQFYRFGYMYISASELLSFTEIGSNETKSNLVSHFQKKTPFEYDEEYLIIHLCQEMENQKIIQKFLITDLKAIYPLSRQAKQSIQDRIDSRIKLEEPIFENLIPAIISNIENNEIEMSISALWTIFDLDSSSDLIKHKIGVEHIYKGIEFRKEGVKSFQMPNVNIWSILIAYDRYEYFPNSTLGYFFDAGQVFAYSKQSNFENSKLFTLLKSIKEDNLTKIIFSELENSEKSQLYISNTNLNGLKFHIIAPLYLMLKDDFRKCDNLIQSKYFTKTWLEYLKSLGDDFKAAVILLGSFFGYKKVYDLYYDKLNLSFFKNYKPIEVIENNMQTEIIEVQKEKEEVPIAEVEINKEIITNTILETEEIKPVFANEINEVIETVNMGFKIETFILEILKQQNQISLTDLADKIKIAKGDKKKKSNTELETEIFKTETLDVTRTKPKMVIRKQVFNFKTN